ncbi:MAG: HAMP domain-containing histidine kinase [Opitutaceae bacterium]|nr:HAMP domain-containing histidine kinase [Opitutaceae bacterium]
MHLRRSTSNGNERPTYVGLSLLLLFVVMVPSVCLVWFSNRAAENEQLAVLQKLQESYRLNLVLAQERLQAFWSELAHRNRTDADATTPAQHFARVVDRNLADSVVCLGEAGTVLYPDPAAPALAHPGNRAEWTGIEALERLDPAAAAERYAEIAARATSVDDTALALQAHARCLLRSDRKTEALALLERLATDDSYGSATDNRGRLIGPNAGLLALELLDRGSPCFAPLVTRLRNTALAYDNSVFTSPQRRFVLRELQRLAPDGNVARWLAAEDLAASWPQSTQLPSGEPTLLASEIADLWQLPSADRREVLLFRTESLRHRLTEVVSRPEATAALQLAFIAPGQRPPPALAVQLAGAAMPGWQIALISTTEVPTGKSPAGTYLWIAGVAVLLGLLLASLAWELLRRQLALTRLRNDLVANVTHELKTPLASMRLFVDTLLNNPDVPPETGREYLELIAKENLRLSRLIDNFLTYSRIERNRYVYVFTATPAASIAEAAATVVRERFQQPGCTFTVTLEANLPRIDADSDALVTALVNLLDNAWKYSGPERRIAFAVERRKRNVAFSVTDNGVGLTLREARRVFHRFEQVRSQSSNLGGCGLGLSIVQSIIAAHRGTVGVDSEPGRGSTFTIELPATE